MLVLTRKLRETIVINDQITVTILRVTGGAVRIGIEAPREVPVRRAEIEPHSPAAPDRSHTAA
jgi:carbon storage regulator